MQELRSTEILDKEIQEDAQKKAKKILKNADFECQKILASVESRVNQAEEEKKLFYEKKISVLENDQAAAIPLEKERFEVTFVQNQLSNAMNEYLANLSEEKRMDLIFNHFESRLSDDSMKVNFQAYVYGFDFTEAKKYLSEKFGSRLISCVSTDFGKIVVEDDGLETGCNLDKKEGFIIESEDKSIRLRLSLTEVVENLFNEYRAELAEALFK